MSNCKRSTDLVGVRLGCVNSIMTAGGPLTSCQSVKVPEQPRWLSCLVTTLAYFSVELKSDKIRRSCEPRILHGGWGLTLMVHVIYVWF